MRVNVGSLLDQKGGFLQIEEKMPSEFVTSYPEVIEVDGPIAVSLVITNTGDGLLVTGDLTLPAKLRCSRCLKPFGVELEAMVEEKIPVEPSNWEEEEFDWEAQPVLDGTELDLTSLVKETLLVSIPMKTVCREDCPGICPTCGADLATEGCACPSADVDIRLAPLAELLEASASESQERRKNYGGTKKKTVKSQD